MNIFIEDNMIILKNKEQKDWERNICSQYEICKKKGLKGVLNAIEKDYKELYEQILNEKLEKIAFLRNIESYLDTLLFEKQNNETKLKNIYNDLRHIRKYLEDLEREYGELSTMNYTT